MSNCLTGGDPPANRGHLTNNKKVTIDNHNNNEKYNNRIEYDLSNALSGYLYISSNKEPFYKGSLLGQFSKSPLGSSVTASQKENETL